jgi:hypothetical protein
VGPRRTFEASINGSRLGAFVAIMFGHRFSDKHARSSRPLSNPTAAWRDASLLVRIVAEIPAAYWRSSAIRAPPRWTNNEGLVLRISAQGSNRHAMIRPTGLLAKIVCVSHQF